MKLSTNIRIRDLEYCEGDVSLPPNETYSLVIDYPLSTPYQVNIKTGLKGVSAFKLLRHIGKAYKHVYANEKKYGIWGHDMRDLAVSSISVDKVKKTIRLDVSS